MHIDKHIAKKLPKIVESEEDKKIAEYVLDVLSGMKKGDALKAHFPDRYKTAIDRADGNTRLHASNIKKQINHIERTKVCKKLYEEAHKNWWILFLEKKHKLYENLYGIALDDGVIPRDRIAASKVMLEHMPTFQEDVNVKVEVKQSKEDFVAQLKEMQKKLHQTAVGNTEDVIDVETN
jgi:hypothetical protein